MRAKLLKEDLGELLKPKSLEEIFKTLQLEEGSSLNDILVKAIESKLPLVIKYALNKGANQLWYESGGPMGGSRYDNVYDSPTFVKIVDIKGASGGYSRGFYVKTNFKVVFQPVFYRNWDSTNQRYFYEPAKDNNTSSSELFYRKYSPITDDELRDAERTIESIKELLKTVNKWNKKSI
jgi:hypothetical protein